MEWLIFGGAYVRSEGCVSKLIGPVYRKFTVFALFYFVFEGSFPSTSPGGGGGYVRRGDFTDGFLCYEIGGLEGRAYFRNFTAISAWDSNVAAFKCAFTRILNDLFVNV